MRIRLSTMMILGLATGAGFILFQTSQNVQQVESRLRNTQTALAKEQDALRVLETEWDYLNRPDRLEELARQHLNMQAQSPAAMLHDSGDLPDPQKPLIPGRKPVLAAQPAVAASVTAVAPASIPAELPMPAPVTNTDSRQQFNTLLNTLTGHEPAAGGGVE